MRAFIAAGFLLLGLSCASAQESTEDRMRDALRQSVTEMRAAQDQLAQAQADLQKANAEKAALQTQLDAANAKLAGNTVKPQELADMQAQLKAAQEQASAQQQLSAKLQASYQAAAQQAAAKDDQARIAQAGLTANTQALQTCKATNVKLIGVAEDILHLYESQSFRAILIKSYEPVLGLAKVKLENIVQQYDDKIHDQEYFDKTK